MQIQASSLYERSISARDLNYSSDSAMAPSPGGGDTLEQIKRANPWADKKASSRMPIEESSICKRSISVKTLNHSSDYVLADSPDGGENLGQWKERTLRPRKRRAVACRLKNHHSIKDPSRLER